MDTKLTTKELEDIINSGGGKSEVPEKTASSVVSFIRYYNVKRSTKLLSTAFIYYCYKATYYKNVNRCATLGRTAFFREFSKHFKQHRKNNQRFYYVDGNFDFSEENMNRGNNYKHKRGSNGNDKQKEEGAKTKSDEASSSEAGIQHES